MGSRATAEDRKMLTKIGIGIGALGWAFMLIGVGQGTEGVLGAEVNMHKVEIAESMILTGGLTTLCGVVRDGVKTLIRNLA